MTEPPDGGPRQGSGKDPGSEEEAKPARASRYLIGRMAGASMLNGDVIRTISTDGFATFQAMQIALLAALSAVMTGTLWGEDPRVSLAASVVAWLAWVMFAHLTATRALGVGEESQDWNRLLRSAGMALTPAIFLLFSRVPVVGLPCLVVGAGWTVIAMTGAVRYTYDGASWSKAVQASIVGWLAASIVYVGIVLVNGQIRT